MHYKKREEEEEEEEEKEEAKEKEKSEIDDDYDDDYNRRTMGTSDSICIDSPIPKKRNG